MMASLEDRLLMGDGTPDDSRSCDARDPHHGGNVGTGSLFCLALIVGVMTRIGHGGEVYVAARELGRGLHRILDFSASINPLGPSPKALRTVADAGSVLQHYPDRTCWDLRQALGIHWQRPAEEFLIGNGSTELIHLLPAALQIRHLLIVGPTFSEYAAADAAIRRTGEHGDG